MAEVENSTQQTSPEVNSTVKKPARKKPAAKKPVARKATAKSASKGSAAKKTESPANPIVRAADTARTIAYGHLGIYGFVIDSVGDSVDAVRSKLPQRWEELVQRGKKVEQDVNKNREEVIGWIKEYSVKEELNQAKENLTSIAESVKQRISKAA